MGTEALDMAHRQVMVIRVGIESILLTVYFVSIKLLNDTLSFEI